MSVWNIQVILILFHLTKQYFKIKQSSHATERFHTHQKNPNKLSQAAFYFAFKLEVFQS